VQKMKDSNNPLYWDQGACREPILLEPKTTKYMRYRAKVDFTDKQFYVFDAQEPKFELSLHFDFLSKEHGKASERFPVATLVPHIVSDSEKSTVINESTIHFYTTKKIVDFEDARPVTIQSQYPVDREFVRQDFCGKQITLL